MPRSPLVVKNGSRQRRRVSSSMPTPVSRRPRRSRASAPRCGAGRRAPRAQRQRAAVGHRVDGVEDQVGQRLAHLAFDAQDRGRSAARSVRSSIDDAALLRHVAPARAGELDHLLHQRVELDRRQRQLRLALAIELAHARDGRGHVLDGALDGLAASRAPAR